MSILYIIIKECNVSSFLNFLGSFFKITQGFVQTTIEHVKKQDQFVSIAKWISFLVRGVLIILLLVRYKFFGDQRIALEIKINSITFFSFLGISLDIKSSLACLVFEIKM
eukprot:TRINITY_DN3483_c0_g1_i1.p7 TRINITY_DN3483_c0_g1~~TRINITY_DN3483_c0_g1_i1.p7  ORF type:complete len:110 (-),score=2.04 TRINITY_DN3483_c0_g1_i1:962-1291(-)